MPSRSHVTAAALLTAGMLLATGCAPQLDRIEAGVQDNTTEVADLRTELRDLKQEMQVVTQLLRLEKDSGVETEAQRLARLSQLSIKIDQLMQKLDDNAEYMRSLSARVDLLATRSGIPTLGDYKPPASNSASGGDSLPEEARAIFNAAELDRSRGNIELAREGFTEFLERFEGSELADDAEYWLADLAYGEKRYSEALTHFRDLIGDYPASERVPAGMLKAAYCLQSLRRDTESREMFTRLTERFPGTPEAALAREQLSD